MRDAADSRPADAAVNLLGDAFTAGDTVARMQADAVLDVGPRPMLPAGVLFMDNFQGNDVGEWTVGAGIWTICASAIRKAYCQSDLGQTVSLVGDPAWTDYEVQVTVTVDSAAVGARPELIFRATSATKYYAVQVFTDAKFGPSIEVASHLNGASGHAGGSGFSFKPDTPFPLHVKVVGKLITVYYADNKGTFPLTMNGMPASGRVGLGSKGTGVKFTDFKVSKL